MSYTWLLVLVGAVAIVLLSIWQYLSHSRGPRWLLKDYQYSPLRYLFAFDVDDRIPDYGDKDGYGTFTALATFALAQGIALTSVAKGEDRTWLVLSIYAVAVGFTVLWLRSMLGAVKTQPATADKWVVRPDSAQWHLLDKINVQSVVAVGGTSSGSEVRAYDRPTITYGRWAQFWTLVLALVLIILGTQGLLPNQTTRVPYNRGECLLFARDVDKVGEKYYDKLPNWYIAFHPKFRDGKQLIWFEQTEPLVDYYTPFRMKLTLTDQYKGDNFQVFLVRRDPNHPGFRFQEVVFIENDDQRTFEVVGADRQDYFVVIGYVEYKQQNTKTISGDADAMLKKPD